VILTRRQTNYLFERIETYGQDPADFQLQDRGSAVDLVHTASKSTCSIWRWDQDGLAVLNAKMTLGNAELLYMVSEPFAAILGQLGTWLAEVEYEATTPDKWAELRDADRVLELAQQANASNDPFTADEQAEVSARVAEARQLAEKLDLNEQQLEAIKQRLDYADKARERLGRKDWIVMFYTTMISAAVTDAIPPSAIRAILTLVLHGLGHLFGFGGGPPVIDA
jgi:hypothetical protein